MDTTDLEQQLLLRIPDGGASVSNSRLLRDLGWQEQEYWDVRNRLVDRGVLELGRGRGGSVRRVVAVASATIIEEVRGATPVAPVEQVLAPRMREEVLYQPLAKVLEERWIRDRRFESSIVQVTALQGRRPTGGKWSRPDIAIATLSTYPYVPGRHFDVVTFEVKPFDAIDVTAVYEALAHLRSATRAYVMLHVPDDQQQTLQGEIDEVAVVAKQHGVGLITFADPASYETWEDLVEAERSEPDP